MQPLARSLSGKSFLVRQFKVSSQRRRWSNKYGTFNGIKKIHIIPDEIYFPRLRHSRFLTYILENEPEGIIPVIGVPNVGKTTMLRHLLQGRIVAHIDLRKQGVIDSVDVFIRVLLQQFKLWDSSNLVVFEGVKKVMGGGSVFGFDIPKDKAVMDMVDFQNLLKSIDKTLQQIKTVEPHNFKNRPVIFLDDSNKLKYLLEKPEVLRAFFDWAVSAGKADKLCHFVVASSSGLFVRWLQTEFGEIHVVIDSSGDLDEAKAAMFFYEYVLYLLKHNVKENQQQTEEHEYRHLIELAGDSPQPQVEEVPPPTRLFPVSEGMSFQRVPDLGTLEEFIYSSTWNEIWAVVGGNMYFLRLIGQEYASGIPLEASISSLTAKNIRVITEALRPEASVEREGRGKIKWTRGEWYNVMLLLDVHNGTISYQELLDRVFPCNPRGLESLINYDLLWYKPTTARSIDEGKREGPTVTALGPAYLHAIRSVLANLPKPIIRLNVGIEIPGKDLMFRRMDLNAEDWSFPGLQRTISGVFGIPLWKVEKGRIARRQYSSSVIFSTPTPDQELWCDADLNLLKVNDWLVVELSSKRGTKKKNSKRRVTYQDE